MRPGFREGMEQFGDLAKGEMEARRKIESLDESASEQDIAAVFEEAKGLDAALDWQLANRAKKSDTSKDTQREVYDLQKRKQEVMAALQRELVALDDIEAKESAPEGSRAVSMRDGKLLTVNDRGEQFEVTMGDIVTDGTWGIEYQMDKASVPRVMRKRVLVERARRHLEDLLDEQILTEELGRRSLGEGERKAYSSLKDMREEGEERFGFKAERMVTQTVRKMIIDDGRPFRYESANVFQDVRKKIDFIIRSTDYGRGVKVESDESGDIETKGVQLTIKQKAEDLQRKQQQIDRSKSRLKADDRIDDIALMSVDNRIIGRAYETWNKKGRPPGGPDRFMPPEFREKLFAEMTSGMAAA